jgi:hypothetical protein
MIHLWLVDFQEILEGIPRQTMVYTFSFKLPRHEVYTMDDLPGGTIGYPAQPGLIRFSVIPSVFKG